MSQKRPSFIHSCREKRWKDSKIRQKLWIFGYLTSCSIHQDVKYFRKFDDSSSLNQLRFSHFSSCFVFTGYTNEVQQTFFGNFLTEKSILQNVFPVKTLFCTVLIKVVESLLSAILISFVRFDWMMHDFSLFRRIANLINQNSRK